MISRLAAAALLLAAVQIAAPGAAQAATVYADPAGACAGLVPCFMTLQAAVDNAAPAPATVGLFPGTYAESVDLDSMGSAVVGGAPGDLVLQALDAAGMPATTGVLVDPGALGGPGAGFGISAGQAGPFGGDIALRGVAVTSPDSVGLALLDVAGGVELSDFNVEGASIGGAFVDADGPVTATDVVAFLNGGNGLVLVGSEVLMEDVIALRNLAGGAGGESLGPLTARRVAATGNGGLGFGVFSCTSVDVEDVTADDNDESGALISVDPAGCVAFAAASGPEALGRSAPFADAHALLARPPRAPALAPRLGAVPVVATVTNLSASGNGDTGAIVGAQLDGEPFGGVVLEGILASGNERFGLGAFGEEVHLTDGTFTDNLSGAVVLAPSALVSQVTASDNAPAAFTPPMEGAGVYVISLGVVELTGVEAERNAFGGLVLDTVEGQPAAVYRVADSRFADNPVGIVSTGDGLADVEIADTEAAGNSAAGIALPNLRRGVLRATTATGNPTGILANVRSSLEVRESEIAANQEGIALVVQTGAFARVHCSNVRANTPSAGLHLVDGAAADARANFWGDASGPTHPGNPGGLGDLVRDGANGGDGAVDYSGFLAAEATAADCIEPVLFEIPTVGGAGLALLALLLLLGGLAALRGR